jgi:hypothetical protein
MFRYLEELLTETATIFHDVMLTNRYLCTDLIKKTVIFVDHILWPECTKIITKDGDISSATSLILP